MFNDEPRDVPMPEGFEERILWISADGRVLDPTQYTDNMPDIVYRGAITWRHEGTYYSGIAAGLTSYHKTFFRVPCEWTTEEFIRAVEKRGETSLMDIELSDIIHAIEAGTEEERAAFMRLVCTIPVPVDVLGPAITFGESLRIINEVERSRKQEEVVVTLVEKTP